MIRKILEQKRDLKIEELLEEILIENLEVINRGEIEEFAKEKDYFKLFKDKHYKAFKTKDKNVIFKDYLYTLVILRTRYLVDLELFRKFSGFSEEE